MFDYLELATIRSALMFTENMSDEISLECLIRKVERLMGEENGAETGSDRGNTVKEKQQNKH